MDKKAIQFREKPAGTQRGGGPRSQAFNLGQPQRRHRGNLLGVDVSSQIRKEQEALQKKQDERRQIAAEAMRLAHERQMAEPRRAQNKENDCIVPAPTAKKEGSNARRALFMLNVNLQDRQYRVAEEESATKIPRPIVKTGKTHEVADLMENIRIAGTGRGVRRVAYKYEPKEILALNPKK